MSLQSVHGTTSTAGDKEMPDTKLFTPNVQVLFGVASWFLC